VKRDVENEDFFSHVSNRVHDRFRVCVSLGNKELVRLFDDFRFFLTLIALLFFFGFLLPLPSVIWGLQYGWIHAYSWMALCIGLVILKVYREVIRRDKAMLGTEWVSNRKAIDDYITMVEKKD